MKRTIVVALTMGLVAGVFAIAPAEAKKKKPAKPVRVERVVEFAYTIGGIGFSLPDSPAPYQSFGACPLADPSTLECIEFPLQAGETHVKVEITDASTTKVSGFLSQGDVDGDGIGDGYGEFCGGHAEAVPMASPAAPVRVSFYPGTCPDATPSLPTTGTIKVTFSNMP
jgi:hypothetical protein